MITKIDSCIYIYVISSLTRIVRRDKKKLFFPKPHGPFLFPQKWKFISWIIPLKNGLRKDLRFSFNNGFRNNENLTENPFI